MTTQPFLDNNDITHFATTQAVGTSASTCTTGTLGNLQSNDTLVVQVAWTDPTNLRTLVSLTDTEGYIPSGSLAAYLRSSFTGPLNLVCQVYAFPVTRPSAGVSSEQITLTISGSADHIGIAAAFFAGVFNSSAPWDSNAGLSNSGAGNWAQQNTGSGNFNSPAYSTNQADDLALFFYAGAQTNGPVANTVVSPSPASGTNVVGSGSSAGVNWFEFGFHFLPLTSTQSGAVVNFNTTGNGTPTWYAVDVLTADNNSAGETSTGVLAFGALAYAAHTDSENAKGAMAFTKVSYLGAADDLSEIPTTRQYANFGGV